MRLKLLQAAENRSKECCISSAELALRAQSSAISSRREKRSTKNKSSDINLGTCQIGICYGNDKPIKLHRSMTRIQLVTNLQVVFLSYIKYVSNYSHCILSRIARMDARTLMYAFGKQI